MTVIIYVSVLFYLNISHLCNFMMYTSHTSVINIEEPDLHRCSTSQHVLQIEFHKELQFVVCFCCGCQQVMNNFNPCCYFNKSC